jgi:superfamily II DNA or RNA helicase
LALSNTVASNIDFCLVATTADDYAQLYKGQSNIGFLLSDTWTQLPLSFFEGFGKKEFAKPSIRNPRPHQLDAIEEAKKHFKVETRGKLIFPCGAGKSLTGYWITKELGAKTVIVAVPSLALVKQTLEDYCQESFAEGNPIAPFCICSDEGIGKNDDVAVFTQDMGVVCTTDKAKILDFLRLKTKRTKVIFTTYQSGRVLGEAVNELDFKFDVGIMDESHKTVGASDKLFSHLLFDENVDISKRIFMTATERRYKGSSENILSMDDVEVYGETFTQLSFKNAIDQEILADYKILTLVITQAEIKEYLNQNDFVKAMGLQWEKDIDFRTLSSLVALRKAMQKYPIKHAVTFHSSIKRAKLFEQLQPVFEEAYPSFQGVQAFHVTGSIPTGQRSKIIAEFSQSDKSIITNAKCLTEGVDVPNIDCVLFADPRKSSIDIVQAVGRALRRSKGKEFGYILLPVYTENNDKESIIESEDFQAILQTLRALAANDDRIIEYFREKQKPDAPKTHDALIQFNIDDIIGQSIQTDDLLESIELQAWSRLAKLSWRPFEEAREFVRNMKLTNQENWFNTVNLPSDIPRSPQIVYKATWKNWPDWLGYDTKGGRNKKFIDFSQAQQIAISNSISSLNDWITFKKKNKLNNIPTNPHKTYKQSWKNYNDFFKRKSVEFLPFEDAKKFVNSLNIKKQREWFERYEELNLLENKIPKYPNEFYKEWVSWAFWLQNKKSEYFSFLEAREFLKKKSFKSVSEFRNWLKTPDYNPKVPKNPQRYYSDNWKSFNHFLNLDNRFHKRTFLNYSDAKVFASKLKLKSVKEWRDHVKTLGIPIEIPTNPDRDYKNKGWKGWSDFLGKEEKE